MARSTGTRAWRDLVVVHRLQMPMPVAYLCYAGWGAVFGATQLRQLGAPATLAAVAANLALSLAGLALNTAIDIPADQQHTDKNYLAAAAIRLGRTRLWRWIAAGTVIGLGLAALVVAWTGRWWASLAAAAIVAAHLAYNVGRVKHAGMAGAAVYAVAWVPLPCLLASAAVHPLPPVSWLLVAGLWLLCAGRTAWWSVPDHEADVKAARHTATGMAGTPAVRHGVTGAIRLSCLIMLAGLATMAGALWWRYGLVWAAAGIGAHLAVLASAAAPLVAARSRRALPRSRWMRTRVIWWVTCGEVVLVIIPLVHLPTTT